MKKDYFIQMLPSEIVLFTNEIKWYLARLKGDEIMYSKGDYVIKLPEGVCRIESVGHLHMSGVNSDKEYYMLVPITDETSKVYIPVDSAKNRMRSVISKEDALQLIKSMPDINQKDIFNERMRELEYKEAILSGDNEKIVSIIKLIYNRKQKRMKQGKKVTATDDRYFKQAEDILFSELSFVLNIPKEDMGQFILETIGE